MKFLINNALFIILLFSLGLFAQGRKERVNNIKADNSIAAVEDRAQSIVTVNQLGQTVTNLGQFYAFSGILPSGRWPVSTDHDAIYKMNMYIGLPGEGSRPYNVIQTRASNTKEWDAVPGFHNPDSGKVAISTDTLTWPKNNQGVPYWPLRTFDDKDSINSQEDTYAVYRDETNQQYQTNLVVHQTTYAWSTSKDEDYVIIKFEIENDTTITYNGLYFGMYTDFDAGGTVDDYEDDIWGFDRNRQFYYIYDADGISNDWPGVEPFQLGLVFLETPTTSNGKTGITDWHYSSDGDSPWADIVAEDKIFYQWMSSDLALKTNNRWPNLFHGDDINYDDVNLISNAGQRLDAIGASGPYTIVPGQKLTFIVALVAGQNYNDISENVDRIIRVYNDGLKVIPPPKPNIEYEALNNQITIKWSNEKELNFVDPLSGNTRVKNYKIYKTTDPQRNDWGDPVAVIPASGNTNAYTYTWTDPQRTDNYFYYSYSVTVEDIDGLESGKTFLPSDKSVAENTAEIRPVDAPEQSVNDIKVVPNPYIVSASWERKRLGDPLLGEPVRDLSFTNLPDECTIKIFTLDGDLVKTIEHSNGTGTAFWDIRSEYNQLISTGIYFYHISSKYGEKIGKFAIVR